MITKNRVYGLDLMRSLAMICVILAHSGYGVINGMRYGIVAVESFFVVSGFLIGGILIRDFSEGLSFGTVTYFWKKRWFRTLPLYYAVLLLKFILIDPSIGWNILYYFFFLQSNFYGIQYMNVSWTLVVEEWFYLLIPFFFILFFRKGITAKRFFIMITLFIIANNVLKYIWVLKTNYGYGAMVGNFVFRMDSNLIGVALAGIRYFHKDLFEKLADWRIFSVSLLILVLVFIRFSIDGGGTNDVQLQAVWVRTIWFSLVSLLVACMIPFFFSAPVFASKEGKQPIRWLITWISLLSYPIYLIHVEMYVFLNSNLNFLAEIHPLFKFLFNNTLVVLLAIILYFAIDKPVLDYRSKILKSSKIKS